MSFNPCRVCWFHMHRTLQIQPVWMYLVWMWAPPRRCSGPEISHWAPAGSEPWSCRSSAGTDPCTSVWWTEPSPHIWQRPTDLWREPWQKNNGVKRDEDRGREENNRRRLFWERGGVEEVLREKHHKQSSVWNTGAPLALSWFLLCCWLDLPHISPPQRWRLSGTALGPALAPAAHPLGSAPSYI